MNNRILLLVALFFAGLVSAQEAPMPEVPVQPILVEKIINIQEDAFIYSMRKAKSLCFGALELTNLPTGSLSVGRALVGPDGVTYEFSLQLDEGSGARMYLYSAAVPRQYPVADPCNASADARAKATVLGNVVTGGIRGKMLVSGDAVKQIGIPKLKISGGKVSSGLRVRLSKATPEVRTLLGGTISQTSSVLVVENPDSAVELPARDAIAGSIRIRSATARLTVPVHVASDRQVMQFKSVSGTPTELLVDLWTGVAKLDAGAFVASGFAPDAAEVARTITIGKVRLGWTRIKASEVSLRAKASKIALAFGTVTLDGVNGGHEMQPRISVLNAATASLKQLSGDGTDVTDGVHLVPKVAEGAVIPAAKVVIDGPTGVSGNAHVSVTRADGTGVDGTIRFTEAVDVTSAGSVMRTALVDALKIIGRTGGAKPGGAFDASLRELRIGTSLLSTTVGKVAGTFAPDRALSFSATSSAPSTLLIGKADDGSAAFESAVSNSVLKGSLAAKTGQMQFPTNALAFNVTSLEARTGRILGGVPLFAAEPMRLVNEEPVIVGNDGIVGSLSFASKSLSVVDPLAWTASRDLQLPMGAGDLVAKGVTLLKVMLARGDIVPIGGGLVQKNIDIAPPAGVASVTFRLGGADVEVRRFQIESLELRPFLDPKDMTVLAALTAKGIALDAGKVSHPSSPVFGGTVAAPIAVAAISGNVKIGRDPLAFENLVIEDAKIRLASAYYTTPDAIRVDAQSVALDLKHLDDGYATGGLLLTGGLVRTEGAENARANVSEIALQFSGTKDAPLASGNLRLDNLDAVVNTSAEVAKECNGNRMPMRLSTKIGRLEGPIAINGSKTDFLLAANSADVELFRPIQDPWQCEWDHKVQEAKTIDHPCCETCWALIAPYPCNCRTCTSVLIPEIKVRWQITVSSLNASGTVTQIKVKPDPQKGFALCEGHLSHLNPPVPLFAVTPTIPGGNPLSDAIRAGITLTQGAWQSALATSFGAIGSGLSLFKVGNSFYLYDKCN